MDTEGQKDMNIRREEVLREIAQHKQEIREAKGKNVVIIYNQSLICLKRFRLDPEWSNDSGWVWCDGVSTNSGDCWTVDTAMLIIFFKETNSTPQSKNRSCYPHSFIRIVFLKLLFKP